MRRGWMGAALVTLALTGRAPAQGPLPPAGGPGPMYPPTFANEPTPLPDPQFCPPDGKKAEPPPFSLPNDGSPNAFGGDPPENPYANDGFYVSIGWSALRRQGLGNGVIAIKDPGSNIPGAPFNVDTGVQPPPGSPTILDFHDVSMSLNNGVRGSFGWREGVNAFEISGFYLFQTNSTATVSLPGQLDLPFNAFPTPVGFQGDNFLWLQADRVTATSTTALGNVEANYRHVYCRGLEWLIGVRYIDVDERFAILTDDDGLTVSPVNTSQIATYSTRAHSRIVAPQLGFEWEQPLMSRLTIGMTGKAAWGVNFVQRNTHLERGDGLVGFDNNSSSRQFSHLYDFSAWGTVLLTEQCRLRAGYQLLWLVNVPEAHQQLDFNLGNPNGVNNNNGSIFYHGPMVELQFVF